jgi:transcriptional regulator with XRE-family HTH domain
MLKLIKEVDNVNNELDLKKISKELDRVKLGLKIKALRKEKKITQQQLADKIYKTESSVRKYEKGLVEIPVSVLFQISDALNVSIWELIGVDRNYARSEAYTYEELGDMYENEDEKKKGQLYRDIINQEQDQYYDILKQMKQLNYGYYYISTHDIVYAFITHDNKVFKVPIDTLENLRRDLQSYLEFKIQETLKNSPPATEGELCLLSNCININNIGS